jgi:hypothetical protein
MILELLLMTVSIVAMALVLVHRHLEATRGLKTAVHTFREKADPVIYDFHKSTDRFFSYLTLHNAVLLANLVFVMIVKVFMYVSSKVHRVSSDIVDKASKKTEDLSRGGSASFYLKKIKESKNKAEAAVGGEDY